jgi:hypothetical protein
MHSFSSRFLVPAAVALTLAVGVFAGERRASAQGVEIAPPAVRVEVAGPRPSARYFWVPGYWAWQPGAGYVWYGGRWEAARPGWAWSRAHWAHEAYRWRFVPGRWRHR